MFDHTFLVCAKAKRHSLAIWMVVFSGVIFFGLSAASADHKPAIHLACNEFPPQKMEASPDGLPGFDVEIIREAFAREGTGVNIAFFPWKRALNQVKAGKLDGLCSCSRSPERDNWLEYSDVIGNVSVGVFLKKSLEGKGIRKIDDLQKLKVGVIRGYNLQKELIDHKIQPTVLNDDSQGIKLLLRERLDAFFTFGAPGKYLLSRMPEKPGLKYVEFRSSPYFVCFSKTLPDVDETTVHFNRGLSAIKADGTYDHIISQYQ